MGPCAMLICVTIGEALRRARASTKQEVVATALGVDQPTVSRWESDKTRPTLEQISAFEEAVGRPKGFCLIAAGYVEMPTTAREAIEADPILDPALRTVVLGAYDSAVIKAAHHGSSTATAIAVRNAAEAVDAAQAVVAIIGAGSTGTVSEGEEDRVAALGGRLDHLSPEERRRVERLVDEMLGEE